MPTPSIQWRGNAYSSQPSPVSVQSSPHFRARPQIGGLTQDAFVPSRRGPQRTTTVPRFGMWEAIRGMIPVLEARMFQFDLNRPTGIRDLVASTEIDRLIAGCGGSYPNEQTMDNVVARTLLRNNVIELTDAVGIDTAGEVYDKMALLIKAMKTLGVRRPIRLLITSPGGAIAAKQKILDSILMARAMKLPDPRDGDDKGRPVVVECLVTGYAASAATVIASTCTPGHRYIGPNSMFMIHQPLAGGGRRMQQTDMQINADHIKRYRDESARLYAMNILKIHPYDTKTVAAREDEIVAKAAEVYEWTERDNWLDAEQAIELGLLDKLAMEFPNMDVLDDDVAYMYGEGPSGVVNDDHGSSGCGTGGCGCSTEDAAEACE